MEVIVEIGRFMTLFYEPFSLGLIFSTSLQQVKALEFLVRIIASKSLYLSLFCVFCGRSRTITPLLYSLHQRIEVFLSVINPRYFWGVEKNIQRNSIFVRERLIFGVGFYAQYC